LPTEGLGGLRCDLSATSPKVLWGHCITGLFGYFVRSSDGGPTFLNLRPPGEYATNSNDYLALSDNEALFDVAGIQDTLITKNGGRTFVRLPEAPQGVGVADIVPLSATDWFAQGSSGLWRTSNGGRSWQPVKAPSVTVPAQRLFVATGLFRVSALVPAAEFPTKFYPDATEYPGNVSGCPDLAGVSTTTQLSRTGLAKLLDQLGGSRNDAVEASDPNYWPFILLNNGDWAHFQSVPPGQLVITRLLGSGYAGLAQHCGKAVVSRLWLGQLCNGLSPFVVKGQCREPALAAEVLFLDRRGRWLVVYTYG
jgi:hypothetical protein